MVNKERAISKFLELVQIDSVSYNERGMADYLIHYFTDLGYEVFEDKGSNEKVLLANAGNVNEERQRFNKTKNATYICHYFLCRYFCMVIDVFSSCWKIQHKRNSI